MLLPKFIRKILKHKEMFNFYKTYVNANDLCFDIGANIGERTDVLLKVGAKVIAIEPQSSCFHAMRKKYGNNKKVDVLNFAVGSQEKLAQLMICDENKECSTLSNQFIEVYAFKSNLKWSNVEEVKVVTLENLCQQYGVPKFCKIDVEGYESEVFLGLKTPIKYICFEFNMLLLNDTAKSLKVLSSLGNYHCNYIKYEQMNLVLKNWMPIDEFCNNLTQIIPPNVLTGEIIVKHIDR